MQRQRLLSSDAHLDIVDLQQSLLQMVGAWFAIVGGLASWQYLSNRSFSWTTQEILVATCLLGVLVFVVQRYHLLCAQVFLVLGSCILFALGLHFLDYAPLAYFAVLIVIACQVASNWQAGFIAAVLSSVTIVMLVPSSETRWAALALVWLALSVLMISSRGFYTALGWLWNSQKEGARLLKQLRERQGELNRTVQALIEATRRLQRTSELLAEARRRAEAAREAKERFAAAISHELRTPLNLILGFAETMFFTPDVYGDFVMPTKLRRDIRLIYESSRQLSDLVDDVLDLSRLNAGQLPVRRELSDLGEIIRQAVQAVRQLVDGSRVRVIYRVEPGLPRLHIDRTRIRQVLLNLLKNAVRFTDFGSITVSAWLERDEVIVAVRDTGSGISPEDLQQIFQEFHQVDMSLRRRQEGAGLGLAISKRFVELHGGRIWAKSEQGVGSTFYFSLPVEADIVVPRLVDTGPLRAVREERPVVVVLDDTPMVAHLLMRQLEAFRFLHAGTLAQARGLLRRWQPIALVTNLSPADRAQRQAELRRILPAGVALLTCTIPTESWVSERIGVWRYLTKPVGRERFLRVLGEAGRVHDLLVIEDDPAFARLLERYLETSGAGNVQLRFARDKASALLAMAKRQPDVIVLEMTTRANDGLGLLRALRGQYGERLPRVLAVSDADLVRDLLGKEGGLVQVLSPEGMSTDEAVSYLEALLTALERVRPIRSAPVPTAVPAD